MIPITMKTPMYRLRCQASCDTAIPYMHYRLFISQLHTAHPVSYILLTNCIISSFLFFFRKYAHQLTALDVNS